MSYIVYKDKNIVVVNKPVGVGSQPDESSTENMMSIIRDELASLSEPTELYVVHRLDLVVGGLLVYARNKKTAARLCALVGDGELGKEYLAVIEGECDGGRMSDYLLKIAAVKKSQVVDKSRSGAKLAELEYEKIESVNTERGVRTLVKIRLFTGRFHQIRAQFSSRSLPLVGDGKYGSTDTTVRTPSLFAYKIDISDELGGFTALPDTDAYPWNLFSEEAYERCVK